MGMFGLGLFTNGPTANLNTLFIPGMFVLLQMTEDKPTTDRK